MYAGYHVSSVFSDEILVAKIDCIGLWVLWSFLSKNFDLLWLLDSLKVTFLIFVTFIRTKAKRLLWILCIASAVFPFWMELHLGSQKKVWQMKIDHYPNQQNVTSIASEWSECNICFYISVLWHYYTRISDIRSDVCNVMWEIKLRLWQLMVSFFFSSAQICIRNDICFNMS